MLRGHYGYFGMPHNWRALNGFRQEVRRIWFHCLRRRSQKNRRMGWDWFEALTARFPLPEPRITHPWTQARHDAGYLREEPGAGKPPARICEGESRMAELLDHSHWVKENDLRSPSARWSQEQPLSRPATFTFAALAL